MPIQIAKRVLLVGDHLQLLPMMDDQMLRDLKEVEPDVSLEELARSDFERAFTSTYGQSIGVRLTEQYRMIVVGDADMWARRVGPKSPMRRVFEHMQRNPGHATLLKASEVA